MSTTELLEPPKMDIVKLNVTDTEIAKMKNDFMGLTINGIDDKIGFKKVYESRQQVKRTRVSIVKYADELKDQAVQWQKKVNGEKNRVVAELESIEDYLQAQETAVEEEKARIKAEAERKEQERIQARIDKLGVYGFKVDLNLLKGIDDASFEVVLNNARTEYLKAEEAKQEAIRLQKEEEARIIRERAELEELRAKQAEADRIIKEQQEKVRREQEAKEADLRRQEMALQKEKDDQAAKIRAEEKRIADEAAAAEQKRLHDERIAKAREEAAEEARLKAIADAKQAEIDRKAKEEEDARQEAERIAQATDKTKFALIVQQYQDISYPEMKSAKARKMVEEVRELNAKIVAHIKTKF